MKTPDDQFWRLLCNWVIFPIAALLTFTLLLELPASLQSPWIFLPTLVILPFAIANAAFRLLCWLDHRSDFSERSRMASLLVDHRFGVNRPQHYLYLRSFQHDAVRTNWYEDETELRGLSFGTRLDEEFAIALRDNGTLLCLGRDNRVMAVGAPMLLSTDFTWKTEVRDLMRSAKGIIVLPTSTGGTGEEMRHLGRHGTLLRKTVFVMPPEHAGIYNEVTWQRLREDLMSECPFIPPFDTSGALFKSTGAFHPILGFIRNRRELLSKLVTLLD